MFASDRSTRRPGQTGGLAFSAVPKSSQSDSHPFPTATNRSFIAVAPRCAVFPVTPEGHTQLLCVAMATLAVAVVAFTPTSDHRRLWTNMQTSELREPLCSPAACVLASNEVEATRVAIMAQRQVESIPQGLLLYIVVSKCL